MSDSLADERDPDSSAGPGGDSILQFLIRLLAFLVLCDPTGIFVFGDIGVFAVRISPVEIVTTVLIFATAFSRRPIHELFQGSLSRIVLPF